MLPAALAATWLAAAWNQNAALRVMSPVAAELEESFSDGFVKLSDCRQIAREVGHLRHDGEFHRAPTARHAPRARGVERQRSRNVWCAPIEVVVGAEVHASILKALSLAVSGRSA